MQPSIKASIDWLLNAPLPVKLAFAGGALVLVLLVLLQREIKKRKIVERVAASVQSVADAVSGRYNRFAASVADVTETGAEILPHVIFAIMAGALLVTVPKLFVEFSQGFGGWLVTIGIPIIFSTRALIMYDIAYTKRIKMFLQKRQRRPSTLPRPEKKAPTVIQSVYRSLFGKSEEEEVEQKPKEDGMLYVVGSKNIRQPVKTLKGVSAMGYPAAMDKDLKSAAKQYDELSSVTYWMRYWTVIAVPLMAEQLPVSGHVLSVLPFWPPMRTLYAAWLQLPGTNGAHLGFEAVVPLAGRYWGKIAVAAPSEKTGNFLLSQMVNFLPIPESVKNQIFEVLSTGGIFVVLAVPFLVFPPLIVNAAATIAGLARPIYTSITAIVALESAANEVMQKVNDPNERAAMTAQRRSIIRSIQDVQVPENLTVAGSSLQCTQWLEYWVVYTIFMFVYGALTTVFFWFPLWFHMQLVVTLWLQLPYYRGSRAVFKQLLDLYYQLSFLVLDEPKKKKKKGVPKGKSIHVQGTLTESLDMDEEKREEEFELDALEGPLSAPLVQKDTVETRPMSTSLLEDDEDDDDDEEEEEEGEVVGIDEGGGEGGEEEGEEDVEEALRAQREKEEEEEKEEPKKQDEANVFSFFGWGQQKSEPTPVKKEEVHEGENDEKEREEEEEATGEEDEEGTEEEDEEGAEEEDDDKQEDKEEEGSVELPPKQQAQFNLLNPFTWGAQNEPKQAAVVEVKKEEAEEEEIPVEEEKKEKPTQSSNWLFSGLFSSS